MNKAKVAEIDYGFAKVQGLMLPSGEYRIGVSQIAEFLQLDKTIATREVKALLGKDCQLDKVYSELNPKPVNTVDLKQFAEICLKLAIKWNKTAEAFCLAAIEETHERRFDKAFDKKQSEEEYNARMKARMEGKITRRHLTDAVADYIKRHNITGNKAIFYYKQVTDKIYEGLTGIKTTKKLREKLDVPEKQTPRDYVSDNDLLHIQEVEDTVQRYIDNQDQEPLEAVDQVIRALLLKDSGLSRKFKL